MSSVKSTQQSKRAPRNRTIELAELERSHLRKKLLSLAAPGPLVEEDGSQQQSSIEMRSGIAWGDCFELATCLVAESVDLLFLDPPYNLSKSFGSASFKKQSVNEYSTYLEKIFLAFLPSLRPSATIYVCADWHTSHSVYDLATRYFKVRNRITWEREKGRGAKTNWKNCSEDVWFCTLGNDYTFNVDAVRQRRPVIAPYRNSDRTPKDWQLSDGGNYRDTHPSNLWTDISIPFWSMPENTDHPTQKSEKFMAKLVLASSHPGDLVLDPFAGSGTTCVVAQKLDRKFLGIERELDYALLAAKRIEMAETDNRIQGYTDGVFWPRNSGREQNRHSK